MSRMLLLFVLALAGLVPEGVQAAPPGIEFRFDATAVEDFLRAVERKPLSDQGLAAMVASPGAAGMVQNTLKYVPASPREGYRDSLREIAQTGAVKADPYQLAEAVRTADSIRQLVGAVHRGEAAMARRIAQRLAPHWHGQPGVLITVRLVVGGVSDGFVLDGDTTPQFFIALDKAGGDIAGLEQNISHESVHVLQRQLALQHCPTRATGGQLPTVPRFLEQVYLEGVANFLADPAHVSGTGEYLDMWRDRYRRNETAERIRENAWLFDHLLAGLRGGELGWDMASQIGFYGNTDSRLYFYGREIARKMSRAGKQTLSAEFVCQPERFFGLPAG